MTPYQLKPGIPVEALKAEITALLAECQAMTCALREAEDWSRTQTTAFACALDRKIREISKIWDALGREAA